MASPCNRFITRYSLKSAVKSSSPPVRRFLGRLFPPNPHRLRSEASSRAISRSVRTERPRNYLFKIESFSLLLHALTKTKRDEYESLHFDAGGYKWKLSLYPNGDKKRGGDGYISLYLALVDPKSLPLGKEVHVFVNFFVYDHLRDNYLVLQDGKEKRFHSLKTEWGLAKLLPLKIFNDPSKGYLVDDCCVFGVEVFLNKIESQGGSSLTKNNLSPYESTFTWKIDKFSKILSDFHKSEVFSVGGVKWFLKLYPKGDSRVKGKNLSLFLLLDDHSSFPRGWNIYAEFKLTILDQLNQKHIEGTADHWFSSSTTGWGWSEFMKLSDLKDQSRGLIENDTVIIKAKFITISNLNSMPQ